MTAEENILRLLKRETELFAQAEAVSTEMQTAPAEELAGMMNRRGRMLEEACRIHTEEKSLCGGNAALLAAWGCTANPDDVAAEYRAVFEASMRAKAIANRVRRNSESVLLRLEEERDAAKRKLDDLNSDRVRAIGKYAHIIRAGRPLAGKERKV